MAPKSWKAFWVQVRWRGIPNPEEWSLAGCPEESMRGKWEFSAEPVTKLELDRNPSEVPEVSLHVPSFPRPLPPPEICVHTSQTQNLRKAGPRRPPARLDIGCYLYPGSWIKQTGCSPGLRKAAVLWFEEQQFWLPTWAAPVNF